MELPSKNKTFEENGIIFLTYIAFAYFLFRLLYFAINISHYIPPDEVSHFGFCRIFSKTLLLPQDSEESYSLGLITHVPYLYFFIMGKILNLNFFPVSNLIFLRFFNCMLSFATVAFGYKWIQLITPNRLCHLFFVILITNTPMFSFIGAAVSYDNLTNFFATTSLYYLHFFLLNPNIGRFLFLGISVLGGALTKMTFLPLVLVYLGILIFHERKQFKMMFHTLKKILPSLHWKEKCLVGINLLLLILNMTLYMENIILFGKVVPRANQVLSEKNAMKFRIYAQDRILELYNSDQLTFEQAVQKAKNIQHPGDRDGTLSLLNLARGNKINPIIHLDRIQYVWTWLKLMLHRSVSIAGHIFMPKHSYIFAMYQLIFLFSFFSFIRYWKPNGSPYQITEAFLICLFYGIVLVQIVNYYWYIRTHALGIALQGKYFFPVLVPFYGVVAYFLIIPFKKPFQIIFFILISIYFIEGDFPYFLYNVTPQWFLPYGQ